MPRKKPSEHYETIARVFIASLLIMLIAFMTILDYKSEDYRSDQPVVLLTISSVVGIVLNKPIKNVLGKKDKK